jgi:hypothetical protein
MKTLLKTELGYIEGYGRLSDLYGQTIMGLSPKEYNEYNKVWEEFTVDESLSKYCVGENKPKWDDIPYIEIPRGTMRVYGEKDV